MSDQETDKIVLIVVVIIISAIFVDYMLGHVL